MEIDFVDIVLNCIMLLLLFAILWSLWNAHRTNGKLEKFNLIDLFRTREGYVDRPGLMEITAFIVMTWAFFTMVVQKSLTEWFAALYVGTFVLRAGHAAWLKARWDEHNGEPPKPAAPK